MEPRRKLSWALAAVALSCAALAPAASATSTAPPGQSMPEFAPDRLLVRFDPGTSKAESRSVVRSQGAAIEERLRAVPGLAVIDLPHRVGVKRADARFERLPEVRYAEPDFISHIQLTPDDPFFTSLWGLDNPGGPPINGTADADIDAPEAWNTETGDPAVQIGVIDSGVTVQHPDLAGNLWQNPEELGGAPGVDDDPTPNKVDDLNGWDFIEDDNSPDDENSHGTHVAGTAGAVGDNGIGVTGVNWDVGLMALKAGDADGSLLASAVVEAIGYGKAEGADVINASFTGAGTAPASLTDAISLAPEILFIAAAGNGGPDAVGDDNDIAPQYPCTIELPNIICVAATTPLDTLAAFSNYGDSTVDLAAPGASKPATSNTNILSTEPAFEPPKLDEDFEDADTFGTDWTASPGPSMWTRVADGGDFEITESPSGDYPANANIGIRTTTAVDLTGKSDCRVTFGLSRDFASGDSLLLEGSDDLVSWPNLGVWTGSGSSSVIRDLQGDDGVTPFDFDGENSFYLRFRVISDGSAEDDGAEVDDVKLECVDHGAEAYRFKSGTSMSTPHVAGVAALVLAQQPCSVAGLRNVLLGNVDQLSSLSGKVVTGGRLNASHTLAALPDGCGASPPGPPPAPPPATAAAAIPRCAGREATIVGSDDSDSLRGTKQADVIAALGGSDTLTGLAGNDRLCGGGGGDILRGGKGNDRLRGGPGRDRLIGGAGKDVDRQ